MLQQPESFCQVLCHGRQPVVCGRYDNPVVLKSQSCLHTAEDTWETRPRCRIRTGWPRRPASWRRQADWGRLCAARPPTRCSSAPSTDVSAGVLNARRLGTLSRLSADALREPAVAGACATAIGTLAGNPADLPDAMRGLLELGGHAVTALDGPHAALALPDDDVPDVALLDIGLPGMNGYELLAVLRTRPGCADTDFIALSGYGQPEDRARSLGAGFCAHLVKPPASAELAALLDTLASRRVDAPADVRPSAPRG